MKRIFAINLGSTSTKVAYYEDEKCVCKDTIAHSSDQIKTFKTVFDQSDFRKQAVKAYIAGHGIDTSKLDAVVSRGGQTEPLEAGVFEINEAMLKQAESGKYGVHVTSVGCRIAYEMARENGAVALTVDTPVTDEFDTLARYSGLKEVSRVSSFQALNHKGMAKHYAQSQGRKYEDMNLVVVMLGGGISVVAHRKGRMVDGPDALEGDGPFSNNRCGTIPAGQLVKLCYSELYDFSAMMRHINGEAGLMSYLGTADIRAIEESIRGGDSYAAEVLEAMCYQTAKEIGAYAAVLKGEVEAILLTGGMANSAFITSRIKERVEFIAPVIIMPGEREMESLCLGAYRTLTGQEQIKEFIPKDAARS
jgi:butyrate kinase